MTRTLCINGLEKIVANKLTNRWEIRINKKIIIGMKKIITLTALFFVILTGAKAQNQFSDYVQFLKSEQKLIDVPDPKRLNNFEYRLFPRPISIKKTHSKVIVIFDRKEWEAFHFMHRKMWLRKDELRKQMDEMQYKKQIPNHRKK